MSTSHDPAALLASLQNTIKLQSALLAKFEQREARMQATFEQRMQAVQGEVVQIHHRVDGIVSSASARIAREARDAVEPVATRYDRAVAAASAQLRKVNRMACTGFAVAGAVLLLVLLAGWTALGYYRRELAAAEEAFRRYDDALPVVQAFHASDATLCGGRLCVNVDPQGARVGDKRQYRQAKPRL